jgi:hypothetical protein
MHYVHTNLKQQIEDVHLFRTYFEGSLPKAAFVQFLQRAYFWVPVNSSSAVNLVGDLCRLNHGATDISPFYQLLFVEDPNLPLIDDKSTLTAEGRRLAGDLTTLTNQGGRALEGVARLLPRRFASLGWDDDTEQSPARRAFTHIHVQVLTCRSSRRDASYFDSVAQIIRGTNTVTDFDDAPPSRRRRRERDDSQPTSSDRPTFSLTVRSYDYLYDDITYDLISQIPIEEQATVKMIYDDLRERTSHQFRESVNPFYLMQCALLLLDFDLHAKTFESVLRDTQASPEIALAAVRKTNDPRLLESVAKRRRGGPATEIARLKLKYLAGSRSEVIAQDDLYKSWEASMAILDVVEHLDGLRAFRSNFCRYYGAGPYEGTAATISFCLSAREAFLSGDLHALTRLRKSHTYTVGVMYGLQRDIIALTRLQSAAPRAFISYKHESPEHQQWVRRLGGDLRSNGIDALLDEWELLAGDSISNYMTQGVSEAQFFLLVVTTGVLDDLTGRRENSLRLELQMAAARRYGGEQLKIIALLRSAHSPPGLLRDNLWVDFRSDAAYHQSLETLVRAILNRSDRPPLKPRPRS